MGVELSGQTSHGLAGAQHLDEHETGSIVIHPPDAAAISQQITELSSQANHHVELHLADELRSHFSFPPPEKFRRHHSCIGPLTASMHVDHHCPNTSFTCFIRSIGEHKDWMGDRRGSQHTWSAGPEGLASIITKVANRHCLSTCWISQSHGQRKTHKNIGAIHAAPEPRARSSDHAP